MLGKILISFRKVMVDLSPRNFLELCGNFKEVKQKIENIPTNKQAIFLQFPTSKLFPSYSNFLY